MQSDDGSHIDIELLWFAGCPSHEGARALLREVVDAVAPGTVIRDIDCSDPAVAGRFRFAGSPTIRINGVDVDPGFRDPGDYSPRCRVFHTARGLSGIPERSWVEAALLRARPAGEDPARPASGGS